MAPLISAQLEPPLIVGVIASRDDLLRATRMRVAPDLFEVRLDAFWPAIDQLAPQLPRLRAPLIITVRDPREGGANALSASVRRELQEQFRMHASYLDIELRNVRPMRIDLPTNIQRILSLHDLTDTPTVSALLKKAEAAANHGANIFKLATRTDTPVQLARLLDFFDRCHAQIPVAAMGMGRLGAQARIELAGRGSVLNYAPLGRAQAEGQLTLRKLRTLLRRN